MELKLVIHTQEIINTYWALHRVLLDYGYLNQLPHVGVDEVVVGLVEVPGQAGQGVEGVPAEPAGQTLRARVGRSLEEASDGVGLRV